MQITYDHQADALSIQLTEHPVIRSKQINSNFALDLDEEREVIGIEVLRVRQSGIDPLIVEVRQVTK